MRAIRAVSPFAAIAFPAVLAALSAAARPASAELNPERLRCEYKTDPLAIDAAHPRLFWIDTSHERGQKQTAYEILAAGSRDALARNAGDLWDSGKVASGETIQIPYNGKALASGQQVFWKVRVWDQDGKPSRWSAPAAWTMGLLRPEDWTAARWIAAPPAARSAPTATLTGAQWIWFAGDGDNPPAGVRRFRRTLTLPSGASVASATLAISADDQYVVTLNGKQHAGPRTTDSWKTYQVYDVAANLHAGDNPIVVQAENTSVGAAGVIARLTVTMSDGQTVTLVTDGAWEASETVAGPYSPARVIGPEGVQPWGQLEANGAGAMTPPPYFRRTFTPSKPIKRALLYATALGVYELSLNGARVSDDVLSPGWTEYRKRVHYLAYDVTKRLRSDAPNALGAILGDGWYASYLGFTGKRHFYGGDPALRLQLHIEYADGSQETIGTDDTWKTTYGPIQSADMLMGGAIDTRKEISGWNTAAFKDAGWKRALIAQENPDLLLQAQPNEPIRPTQTVATLRRTEPTKGTYIYDLGQNLVGWVRLTVNGKPGETVTVRHGERLNPDGTLYTTNLRAAKATDTYVLRGGRQTLEPKFTFHGFQYVEVTGAAAPPAPADVVGIVASSDLTPTLTFDSDNPLLNKLIHNIDWGFRGNSLDVPTDCPQRNERLGWMGDAQVFAKTAMFHRDAAPFYTKWLDDVEDAQLPDGAYADVSPRVTGGGNAAWEDAGVVCTYRMQEMYGDTQIIADHWDSLTRYMEHLAKVAPDGIRPAGAFGDWLLLDGPRLSPIHGTAYYYLCATMMAEMAAAIGKQDEAARYHTLAGTIRDAFIARFVTPDGRVQDGGQESQTFYALALDWGLLPENLRAPAAARLAAMIAERGGHLATGFIGTPVLLPALAGAGRADVANALLLNDTYPSWLYQVKLGATTMWERWDGWTPEKGFQDPGMNSFNHYWLGCVGEWVYTGVAGIDTDGPGWSRITIRPRLDGPLKRAQVTYDSIRGKVESGWTKNADGSLTLAVTVPANTTATVAVPAKNAASVTEGGRPATQSPGISLLRQEPGAAVFTVGSGSYAFRVAP